MTNSARNSDLIDKILQQPLLLQQLSDRVYQLLLNDLLIQRDRAPRS
jgi:hypothetical protein